MKKKSFSQLIREYTVFQSDFDICCIFMDIETTKQLFPQHSIEEIEVSKALMLDHFTEFLIQEGYFL